eukprot:Em0006g727a
MCSSDDLWVPAVTGFPDSYPFPISKQDDPKRWKTCCWCFLTNAMSEPQNKDNLGCCPTLWRVPDDGDPKLTLYTHGNFLTVCGGGSMWSLGTIPREKLLGHCECLFEMKVVAMDETTKDRTVDELRAVFAREEYRCKW